MQIQYIYLHLSFNSPSAATNASFQFAVTDRCCCLFIWSGFNNMQPIARSGACCLCGPLSVSCPFIDKREREREGENVDESEMCCILWEGAKWKQGNLRDQYRAESLQNGARIPSVILLLSPFPPLFFSSPLFSSPTCYFMSIFFFLFQSF